MLELLIGPKTTALIDLWTLEHLFSGVSVGHAVRYSNSRFSSVCTNASANCSAAQKFNATTVLMLAYLWEVIEHYLEAGLAGAQVTYWLQGVEHWSNRLIADPLAVMAGYLISTRNPRLVVPARLLSAAWLAIHVFAFPHCMYLQDWLLSKFE
jgi:hypothetical protein